MNTLTTLRARLADMRGRGLHPTRVGLSKTTWSAAQAEYGEERGMGRRKASAFEIFGLPVHRHPGLMGDFIVHNEGLELVEEGLAAAPAD